MTYSIIAKTEPNLGPPVGTIVPSKMAQPEDVVTIRLSEGEWYVSSSFPELADVLSEYGYEPGRLPPDGPQLRRWSQDGG